jgi:hypothetical protein
MQLPGVLVINPKSRVRTTRQCSVSTKRCWQLLALVGITFVAGGATCANRRQTIRNEFLPPVVFDEVPTLQQIAERVNHSRAITQLESATLTISSPEMAINLRGELAWERSPALLGTKIPDNFSLKGYAGSQVFGTPLAAGSNADLFWMQMQAPGTPPTIFYAKHREFDNQLGPRHILPVSPLWLSEALGIIDFDPNGQHDAPQQRVDGKIEVVSYIPTARGTYRRVLVLDAQTGVIEQTILNDPASKMVAMALQSDHQYYSAVDWNLPHNVSIQMQPDDGPPLAFTIEIGFYSMNSPAKTDPNAFAPPDPTGLVMHNLVELNGGKASAGTPPNYTKEVSNVRPSPLESFRR